MEQKTSIKWKSYLIISLLIIFIGGLVQKSTAISIIASIAGTAYALFIAKEKRIAFAFGLVNVITYGIILINEKIYSGAVYNILYSLPMMIYGFFSWGKASKKEKSGIKEMSIADRIAASGLIISAIYVYSRILEEFGGNQALLDSMTSILGYVGIYLMAKKYIEQWPIWIISNLCNVILWTILTIKEINSLPVLLMWIIFLINSVYGYVVWKNKVKK